jgi:rubrerythrin
MKLNDFYNDGFGWICRRCERELSPAEDPDSVSRLMTEGEAESKHPKMANRALAKWADAGQTMLECPRCGITEALDQR